MDILKKIPTDISSNIFKYMRQPYLDNIDLPTIVLHKRCVRCDVLIRRFLPGSSVKGCAIQCIDCNRLICRKCTFFGIIQESIPVEKICLHNNLKLI